MVHNPKENDMKTHGVTIEMTFAQYMELFNLSERLGYDSISDMLEDKIATLITNKGEQL